MTTTLQRIGDEFGLILDQSILDELGIDENVEFLISRRRRGDLPQADPVRLGRAGGSLTGKIMTDHAETLRKLAL